MVMVGKFFFYSWKIVLFFAGLSVERGNGDFQPLNWTIFEILCRWMLMMKMDKLSHIEERGEQDTTEMKSRENKHKPKQLKDFHSRKNQPP